MKTRIEPTLAGSTDGYETLFKPGEANLIDDDIDRSSIPAIFSLDGRLSLSRYWVMHICFVVLIPSILLVFFLVGLNKHWLLLVITTAAIVIPTALFSMSLLMRRARDLGWHPVWGIMAVFVPIAGQLITLPLVLIPGKPVRNEYGQPNTPLSRISILVLCLGIVVCFAVGVLAQPYLGAYVNLLLH